MPEQVTLAVIISVISVAFSVYFGLKNNKRTDTKDIEERVRENTEINVKLDAISNTTSEIKRDLTSVKDDIKSIDRRLVVVEESTKQAHHRLDDFGIRLNAEKE